MPSRTSVFVIFTLAYFLSYFYRSANAVIAPDLAREMNLDAAQLGLMTSLFFAAFAAVQLPLGLGLDRYGPRAVTPALMLAGAAGSLIFAGAQSFAALALGRALIGVGMAGVLMGALKAFSQWFTAQRYPTLSGLLVGIGSAGALFAATPLAWLNATLGWRMVFVVGAAMIVLVAAALVIGTRNTPPGVAWPGNTADLRALPRRLWRSALLAHGDARLLHQRHAVGFPRVVGRTLPGRSFRYFIPPARQRPAVAQPGRDGRFSTRPAGSARALGSPMS